MEDTNTPLDPMADQMKSEDAVPATPATPVSDDAEMEAEVVAEEGEAEAEAGTPVAEEVKPASEGTDEAAS